MGSFKLSTTDGKEVTGAGCMLALVSGAVEFAGIIAVSCLLSAQGSEMPGWLRVFEGPGDAAVWARRIGLALLIAPGILVFLLGSRWLKQKGVAVWRNPNGDA